MCCENPIDLGCVFSCDDVVTNITSECANVYTISFEFNGAVVTKQVSFNGEYLTIPSGIFNDNYATTFKVYDNTGEFVDCFKVTILPSLKMANDTNGELTSSITLTADQICQEGIPSSIMYVSCALEFSDISLLQNGTEIDLDVVITGGTFASLLTTTPGTIPSGSKVTISDISLITGNTIDLFIGMNIDDCGDDYTMQASIECYSNLPATTLIGTQTISNKLINEYP